MRQFVWCLPVVPDQVGRDGARGARAGGPDRSTCREASCRPTAAVPHGGGRPGQVPGCTGSWSPGRPWRRGARRRLRPDRSGQRRSGRRAGDAGGAAGVPGPGHGDGWPVGSAEGERKRARSGLDRRRLHDRRGLCLLPRGGRAVRAGGRPRSGAAAPPVVQPADADRLGRQAHRRGLSRQLAAEPSSCSWSRSTPTTGRPGSISG